MKEFAILAMYFTAQIAMFGLAAWLIHARAPGWGWFLLVVALVACSTSVKVDSKGADKKQEAVK